MDLVASYSSEEDETEFISNLHWEVTKATNSLSKINDLNFSTETNQGVSDYLYPKENFAKRGIATLDRESASSIPKFFDKKNERTVDFFHLESSDSDDEQLNLQTNVYDLLSSAAHLKKDECGPKKPIPDTNLEFLSSHSPLPHNKRLKTSLDNFVNNNPKFDTKFAVHKVDESSEFNKLCSKDFMYRKDDRIHSNSNNKNCRIPQKIIKDFVAHASVINALEFCVPQFSHLLLSASTDCCLKIWDIFYKNPLENIKTNAGLKAAKWMKEGTAIVTGGYDKKALVYDVLSGKEIRQFSVNDYVSSLLSHPVEDDLFLCGTRNAILTFDLRVNSSEPVKSFASNCQEVLDIVFINKKEFACSTNIVNRESADRTIMVWDFSSGAILSKQVYRERYTCPSLKVHPRESFFIAQTNGDYIAFFSTLRPYKIQNKRSVGHKVSGYGIECDVCPDGKYIVSGDASGDLYFYNFKTAELVHRLKHKSTVAINRVKWHPTLLSTVATSTWHSGIQIWQ